MFSGHHEQGVFIMEHKNYDRYMCKLSQTFRSEPCFLDCIVNGMKLTVPWTWLIQSIAFSFIRGNIESREMNRDFS